MKSLLPLSALVAIIGALMLVGGLGVVVYKMMAESEAIRRDGGLLFGLTHWFVFAGCLMLATGVGTFNYFKKRANQE